MQSGTMTRVLRYMLCSFFALGAGCGGVEETLPTTDSEQPLLGTVSDAVSLSTAQPNHGPSAADTGSEAVNAEAAKTVGSDDESLPTLTVGCSGTGCNGRTPESAGCDGDARTIDEMSQGGARFEMRYSSACRAVWTRVSSPTHHNVLFGQITAWSGGRATKIYGVQAVRGQGWTRMLSSTYSTRTCTAVWSTSAPNLRDCTSQH